MAEKPWKAIMAAFTIGAHILCIRKTQCRKRAMLSPPRAPRRRGVRHFVEAEERTKKSRVDVGFMMTSLPALEPEKFRWVAAVPVRSISASIQRPSCPDDTASMSIRYAITRIEKLQFASPCVNRPDTDSRALRATVGAPTGHVHAESLAKLSG